MQVLVVRVHIEIVAHARTLRWQTVGVAECARTADESASIGCQTVETRQSTAFCLRARRSRVAGTLPTKDLFSDPEAKPDGRLVTCLR